VRLPKTQHHRLQFVRIREGIPRSQPTPNPRHLRANPLDHCDRLLGCARRRTEQIALCRRESPSQALVQRPDHMQRRPPIDIQTNQLHMPRPQQRHPLHIQTSEQGVIVLPRQCLQLLMRRNPIIDKKLPHHRPIDLADQRSRRAQKLLQHHPERLIAAQQHHNMRLVIVARHILHIKIDDRAILQHQMMQQRPLAEPQQHPAARRRWQIPRPIRLDPVLNILWRNRHPKIHIAKHIARASRQTTTHPNRPNSRIRRAQPRHPVDQRSMRATFKHPQRNIAHNRTSFHKRASS